MYFIRIVDSTRDKVKKFFLWEPDTLEEAIEDCQNRLELMTEF